MGNFRWRLSDTILNFLKMDIGTCLSLLIAVITLATPAQSSEPRVVCYYTNWSVYRPGTAKFNPQNINPYLCTHLIYAFGAFTKENTLKPFDKYQDIEKGGYAKFVGLKTYNKNLKTLLAIGGWNEGSTRFSPMVASRERRKEFVRNAIKFLRQNRFDGLDLDWEYPAFRDGGKAKDRDNYAKLVKELREEFEKESEKTGKPRLLLTMAVPAGIEYIQKGFDVKTLNRYLDWMNLLSYDYHSAFEPAVNHHAPLFPLEEPNEYSTDNELNIDYTIKFYIENGADADKLVLGIPTYGRSYTLFNPDAVEIGSPADGPGEQGDATREKGYLAYYEICEALKPKEIKRSVRQSDDDDDDDDDDSGESSEVDVPWTVMYPNPNAMGPVAFKGNQWVGYDDVEIVKKKAEYVADNGLGGIMFWSIDNDDFRGTCHNKPYPLIEAAKEAYIAKLGATDNAIISQPVTKASTNRRNRPRVTTTTTTTTAKPSAAAKTLSSKRKSGSSYTSTTPAWNANTPEPPTTPDPGADFKCKDEGFFPHPRDCKKYFWCLDSGPSNLGIVAHQFTCPSGLFFNKAADSCDFARNVLCKKPSATTKATTKAASTTSSTTTTTTRRPIKLSTKNSVLFRTTTTTTTPEPESEEEIEEEVPEDTSDVDAEDPKVIKELIDLIKKVGGVEQLEKHLRLSETLVSTDGPSTTPTSLNKKLYKVLERTRGKNKFNLNTASEGSSSQNSRRGPQNAGLESPADKSAQTKKDRPQYITINRSRATTASTEASVASEESTEKPFVSNFKQSRSRVVESTDNGGTTSRTLQYVNIRRAPSPSTSDTADDTASRNALFERVEPYIEVSETPSTLDIRNARRENMPEYVTIRRQRPTTEETTTSRYLSSERNNESQGQALEREISSQPQYTSIVRARSTTLPPPDDYKNPEPTTILAVQISSLLNSPSPTEAEVLETETEAPPTEETEATTVSSTTTTTTTPTTTTTTTTSLPLILSSSIAPRPLPIRRRGSTTITPFTTIQVSPRNYTFVSRRRVPISKPNEILADSDETNEVSRKIRSTTPNSREVVDDKVRIGGEIRQVRKKRVRIQSPENVDDSVPAAASPISRGQFRPQFSRDEVVSLTPIDNDPPLAVHRPSFVPRNERRFRGKTTVSDKVEDSEVSAATVDVRRPSFPSRGRGKFTPLSTVAVNDVNNVVTESTPNERKPIITRFTPRPFNGRRISPSEDSVTEENLDISSTKPVTQSRLSFKNPRPTLANVIQGRKLPFPYRQRPSTEKSLTINEDDELENKPDDISLSESTIEEKEHEDYPETTTQLPKRRIIIKKLRTPVSSTTDNTIYSEGISTENISTDDNSKKKFKIIRRRPTSTTVSEASSISTENPVSPRIRKIIRKKLKPVENEPEILAKSVNSLNASPKDTTTEVLFNYGEKTIPTTSLSIKSSSVKEEEEGDEVVDHIIPGLLKVETSTDLNNEELDVSNKEDAKNSNILQTELSENNEVGEKTDAKSATISNNQSIGNNLANLETISTDLKDIKNEKESSENDNIPEISDTVVETKTEHEIAKIDNQFETENSKQINKPEVVLENEEKSIDSSETETLLKEPPVNELEEQNFETKPSTTQKPTPRTRLPYRPTKRLFSSTTEGSVPSSSRTFSRKFNPGAYTSPATSDRENTFRSTTTTRRPLFTPRQRRPYTTAKITTKVEEEEEYSEEEILDEEPENPLVFVPPNQHFPRNPAPNDESEHEYDNEPEGESDEENSEEEKSINVLSTTSRKPSFIPRVVNSNSFRIASTTESLRKPYSSIQSQNRTVVQSRFALNKSINETKKRVQNVPIGYGGAVVPTSGNVTEKTSSITEKVTEPTTTITSEDGEMQTVDDDYLSMTESTTVTLLENTNTVEDVTSTSTFEIETATMEISNTTDDYLEYTVDTTTYPTTQGSAVYSQTITEGITSSNIYTSVSNTETSPETTTSAPVTPKVKTQLDKLFSVSRVVEVSSKLDKHRLNKNNETTLIEEGKIMVEKKPVVNKIGEVSRFSFIKIVEDEIPIYLTKLGHIYPVENPPDNPIRIDEARNARALTNFAEAPRENLVASESINEAYRHIKKVAQDNFGKDRVERVASDDFLSYVNDEKKTENSHEDLSSSNWQFIPAAYENEKLSQTKAAKSFEIITPRSMLTDPSTLPLEALFQTETPATARKLSGTGDKQPFVVYSASLPTQKDEANIVKLQIIKPEAGRSIVTFAKGQEFNGGSVVDESNIKYPINISVLPNTSESSSVTLPDATTTTNPTTERGQTSPILELLTTTPSITLSTETQTLSTITDIPSTTEITTEETTTQKPSPLDAKRTKFAFPRRPIIKTNITRPTPRTLKKLNTTSSNLSQKPNKTFVPSGRYSAIRSQNVPVDIRKSITPKSKSFTTEAPKTTTERRVSFKPLRPVIRPAFVPRKSRTTPSPTTES